ncbi:DNA oxidative demethylase AlkB [Variovorax sp. PAMC 28711]|uniref:DNA oxidative demethylase AlkB n=1 Tax=Variovorax sp. PAMC 28711 TaxID=1795631 RepID=UPI00078DCFAA|nr:DNA oxidative demethylase AlkB [Variovorax sp. PAMC 28711]AMM25915.1 alpha-ketoglutarate-dependent dioxygenase AlkB [Variovorax sp. PAMC 28711]
MRDLFAAEEGDALPLAPGAVLLRDFALAAAPELLLAVVGVTAEAPWRHLETPGGFGMSVAMTNCGALGWVSDRTGYRYDATDPLRGKPWPALPDAFREMAHDAAAAAGYGGFVPDACLVNRYEPGARLSLHQDRDEHDYGAPIVSVSLGLPVTFLFGGAARVDKSRRVSLVHGDVVVWGGPSRLHHHAVLPLADGEHPATGRCRINLTFRKAG